MLRRTLVPALAAAAVALSACGGSGRGPVAIDGTGYRTTTPAGWTDAKKLAANAKLDIDRFYASVVDHEIRDNVIITRERPPTSVSGRPVGELEPRVRAGSAEVVGVATPPAEPPTALDGEDARTWTIRRSEKGRAIVQRQLIAVHGGVLYTVTLSSLAKDDDGEAALRTVRTGWHWD